MLFRLLRVHSPDQNHVRAAFHTQGRSLLHIYGPWLGRDGWFKGANLPWVSSLLSRQPGHLHLTCFVILFLYCEHRTFITFHLLMHMQIGYLTSSGSSLFIFSIGGLWIICSCFGIFLILLYCLQCSSSSTPFVDILIFLIWLRKKLSSSSSGSPTFLCAFFLYLFLGFCFPSLFFCDFFPSFLHSPPSYLLLAFPCNCSWSSKFSRMLIVQSQHCCMASLCGEVVGGVSLPAADWSERDAPLPLLILQCFDLDQLTLVLLKVPWWGHWT